MTDTNFPDNIRPGMTGDATADPAQKGHEVGEAFTHTAQQEDQERLESENRTDNEQATNRLRQDQERPDPLSERPLTQPPR
ncbi:MULTISPECIES: hypothetical protein [unclassified Brevundimonas]|uniref:hypothetical protein n=1 Tax=unclassified Brevundimonas TaxID=2622653 RepID=UPI0025BE4E1B|nr:MULTISPECIES: hypothetical protein [unclassified Brevundimonas]